MAEQPIRVLDLVGSPQVEHDREVQVRQAGGTGLLGELAGAEQHSGAHTAPVDGLLTTDVAQVHDAPEGQGGRGLGHGAGR